MMLLFVRIVHGSIRRKGRVPKRGSVLLSIFKGYDVLEFSELSPCLSLDEKIEAKLKSLMMKNLDIALAEEGLDKHKLVSFYNSMKVNPDSSIQEPARVYRAPAGHMNFKEC